MHEDGSLLVAQGVAKSYGSVPVLRRVDLAVPRGSVVGLLGRNGAGKTTLLECAVGLLHTDAGRMELFGEPSRDLSAGAKARLGFVPQTPRVSTWMTVGQSLKYTAAFYPTWHRETEERLLDAWGLRRKARARDLSVGAQRQLMIIQALAPGPDLLILDEPAANLDPVARRGFLDELIEIALEGDRSVLFSTHATGDIERVADRVAMLKDGEIHFAGELAALKEEVVRLTVEADRQLPPSLEVPGALWEQVEGREAAVSVVSREPQSIARELEQRHAARVHLRPLSLDEIFLELHDVH